MIERPVELDPRRRWLVRDRAIIAEWEHPPDLAAKTTEREARILLQKALLLIPDLTASGVGDSGEAECRELSDRWLGEIAASADYAKRRRPTRFIKGPSS